VDSIQERSLLQLKNSTNYS